MPRPMLACAVAWVAFCGLADAQPADQLKLVDPTPEDGILTGDMEAAYQAETLFGFKDKTNSVNNQQDYDHAVGFVLDTALTKGVYDHTRQIVWALMGSTTTQLIWDAKKQVQLPKTGHKNKKPDEADMKQLAKIIGENPDATFLFMGTTFGAFEKDLDGTCDIPSHLCRGESPGFNMTLCIQGVTQSKGVSRSYLVDEETCTDVDKSKQAIQKFKDTIVGGKEINQAVGKDAAKIIMSCSYIHLAKGSNVTKQEYAHKWGVMSKAFQGVQSVEGDYMIFLDYGGSGPKASIFQNAGGSPPKVTEVKVGSFPSKKFSASCDPKLDDDDCKKVFTKALEDLVGKMTKWLDSDEAKDVKDKFKGVVLMATGVVREKNWDMKAVYKSTLEKLA